MARLVFTFFICHNTNKLEDKLKSIKINEGIKSEDVRLIDSNDKNVGVVKTKDAIKQARDLDLDLVQISSKVRPPIAKIVDYGKYSYEMKKKAKKVKSTMVESKTKSIQIKVGTGKDTLETRSKKICQWLAEGNRIRVDLFLWGRYKYMDKGFLQEKITSFLDMIPCEFSHDEIQKSPKGYSVTLQNKKK